MLRNQPLSFESAYSIAALEDPNDDPDDDFYSEDVNEDVHIELQLTDLSGGRSSCDDGDMQCALSISPDGSQIIDGSSDQNDELITHFSPRNVRIRNEDVRAIFPICRESHDNSQAFRERQFIHQQARSCQLRQQRLALLLGILPVACFSYEMIPSWCQYLCLQEEDVSMDAYFFTVAFCGGLGAALYGTNPRYVHARIVGGSVSALGSLFTNWMLLSSMSSHHPSYVAVVFGLIGCFVGSMPGVLVYFIFRILSDECHLSDIFMEKEFYYEDSERSRLTEPLTSPLHTVDIAMPEDRCNEKLTV